MKQFFTQLLINTGEEEAHVNKNKNQESVDPSSAFPESIDQDNEHDSNYEKIASTSALVAKNQEPETAFPSEHFVLKSKYQELSPTKARVLLQERTKELEAISRANQIFGEVSSPISKLIETYVSELPQWVQYPNVAEAKIIVGDTQVETTNFQKAKYPLYHETQTDQETRVGIELVYTESRSKGDDGPWLDEEHILIETLLSFILNYQNQWEKRQQIKTDLDRQTSVAIDVEAGVEDARKTAQSIAQSAEDIADHAHRSSDSMDEVAAETEDMSATIEEIASTSEEVAIKSQQAEEFAQEGNNAATEAINVMNEIDTSTEEVTRDVDSLQNRIQQIDEIVELINNIADQTNILALNASIEAARAGDAGSGFAVVANEVKSLAGKSQEHAAEIEQLINAIKSDADETVMSLAETTRQVDNGIKQVESTMNTLDQIKNSVTEASDGIREVSRATDDQAASTEEVATMVNELVDESESVADEIQSVAASNEEQVQQIESIESTINKLTQNNSN